MGLVVYRQVVSWYEHKSIKREAGVSVGGGGNNAMAA